MVRIAGINLPEEKRAEIALTYIFGIGRTTSKKLLTQVGIKLSDTFKDVEEKKINQLREIIEKTLTIEGDLRRQVQQDIKSMKEINSYRGIRHKLGLPARGKRTKTNARTKRGKRVTMGSGRRKVTKT